MLSFGTYVFLDTPEPQQFLVPAYVL
jgi:hypothetical protein